MPRQECSQSRERIISGDKIVGGWLVDGGVELLVLGLGGDGVSVGTSELLVAADA
jgi:hypothetical protein